VKPDGGEEPPAVQVMAGTEFVPVTVALKPTPE
jgi:hypothetical protein